MRCRATRAWPRHDRLPAVIASCPDAGRGMTRNLLTGTVIGAHGRHYAVRTDAGEALTCFSRGKKSEAACNDRVEVEAAGKGQGVINTILERTNLIYRSDHWRRKLLAANITQMAIVVATEPQFSEDLLGRALVCAESLRLPVLIVLNKVDLTERAIAASARLAPYTALGYRVVPVSATGTPEATRATLRPLLAGQTTLMLGQSGMGKSSLLNLLVPHAAAATREISQALQSGKHTTTFTRQYDLAGSDDLPPGVLVDTPGFQEFGLAHLTPGQVERAFPELRPLLGNCRFYNCTHLAEPGCAVRAAAAEGHIGARRMELFEALTRECAPPS